MCDAEILLNKIHWCATVCSYMYRNVWYWRFCSKSNRTLYCVFMCLM